LLACCRGGARSALGGARPPPAASPALAAAAAHRPHPRRARPPARSESTDTFGAVKAKVRPAAARASLCALALAPQPPPPLQLAEVLALKDASELRLVGADRETEYKDLAVASDFGLVDDALVYALVGGEAPPAE